MQTVRPQCQALCWLRLERMILEVLYNLTLQWDELTVYRPLLVYFIAYYMRPGMLWWDHYKYLKIKSLHFTLRSDAEQLRTILESCKVRGCGAPEVNRVSGQEASSLVTQRIRAMALASPPSPQEAESWNTGKTGLFPSLSQSILCSNQSERLACDSTAGLSSCTSVLGRGFQSCCKACTSPPESQQPCRFVLPMGNGRKSQNFGAHFPSCVY